MSFGYDELTERSKETLIHYSDGGIRFFGQPIGNSIPLDETGEVIGEDYTPIFDPNQLGSFFEFSFTLNEQSFKTSFLSYLKCTFLNSIFPFTLVFSRDSVILS